MQFLGVLQRMSKTFFWKRVIWHAEFQSSTALKPVGAARGYISHSVMSFRLQIFTDAAADRWCRQYLFTSFKSLFSFILFNFTLLIYFNMCDSSPSKQIVKKNRNQFVLYELVFVKLFGFKEWWPSRIIIINEATNRYVVHSLGDRNRR